MIEHIDPDKCTGCGICEDICPLDTIRIDPIQESWSPCRQLCPAGVDIRGLLYYVKNSMIEKASSYLQTFLPFPAITGILCHHPCEKGCVRKKVDEAINIHMIEKYLGDYLLKQEPKPTPVLHAQKIAVVGSGPAGMTAAHSFLDMGYRVSVFEKSPKIGGAFLNEVRQGRLGAEVLDAEIDRLKSKGAIFIENTCVSKDLGFKDLKEMRFKAVFMAPGTESKLLERLGIHQNDVSTNEPQLNKAYELGVFTEEDLLKAKLPLIKAVSVAKKGACRIDRFLQGRTRQTIQEAKKVRNIPGSGIQTKPRMDDKSGIDENAIREESLRCMSCGSIARIAHPEDCMTCFECEVECPANAITVHPFKEKLPLSLKLE